MDTEIPRIDVTQKGKYQHLLQKFGSADFKSVVQRNIEKDFIERQAALLSIVNTVSLFKKVNGLTTIINATAGGGVKVQYPIDAGVGNTGRNTVNDPLVGLPVSLPKANVTYRVLHEAMMEGGRMAEDDQIMEGVEQLKAKMEDRFLVKVKAKKFAGNDVTAADTWTTTGSPFDDINKAINNIEVNSAVDPNSGGGTKYSLIAPIATKEGMEKLQVVDGVKMSTGEIIERRLKTQILYSRKPFRFTGTWSLLTQALLIPTKDRHVGKFYTFDGGAMPSIFQTIDEDGKRVSSNSWMEYQVAPSEIDGTTSDNPRIALIANVA